MPEHVAFQQGSDDGPSPEVEHTVHIPKAWLIIRRDTSIPFRPGR